MAVRQTRFGYPYPRMRQQESRVSIFEPTLGFDAGQAPQEVWAGFTPASTNWIHSDGYLTPRSGLSRHGESSDLGADALLFGMEAFDIDGNGNRVAASSSTIAYLGANETAWRPLTDADSVSPVRPAADISAGWSGAYIYSITNDYNIAVLTNGNQTPISLVVQPSTTTYSAYTHHYSLFSTARSVCAVDDRLVWFNVASTTSTFPTRVLWSDRGAPKTYTGAPYTDIMDMRGSGLRAVPDRDGVVLFTEEEIWRGRIRRDIYAFDFYPVNRALGCPYPKTICQTPYGIVFLGRDLEVYVLNGDQAVPLGPTGRKGAEQGDHSRIQGYLRKRIAQGEVAHGSYEARERKYRLFYTSNVDSTQVFPTDSLDFHFDNQSWWPQTYPFQISTAFEANDIEEAATWDSIGASWDNYNLPWDKGAADVASRRVMAFSSNGTPYRFRSDQTSDDGSTITATWRSHGLGQSDQFRHDQLYEVWVEYASPSASSMSVMVSGDGGVTFGDGYAMSLSSSSHSLGLAPVFITAPSPIFELRVNDGTQPKISRIQAALRDGGQFYGGL